MNTHFITPSRLLCASAAVSLLLLAAGCGQQSVGKVVRVDEDALTISETSYLPNEEGNEVITTFKIADDTAVVRDGKSVELMQLHEGDAVTVTSENRAGEPVATKIEAESIATSAPQPIDPVQPDPGPEPLPPEQMPPEPMPPEQLPPEQAPPTDTPPEQDPADPSPAAPDPAPALPGNVFDPPAEAPQQQAADQIGGTLVSVEGKSIVVHGDTGLRHSFSVADDAVVTLDGKESALSDLGAEVNVRVTIERRDDTFVATRVAAETPE